MKESQSPLPYSNDICSGHSETVQHTQRDAHAQVGRLLFEQGQVQGALYTCVMNGSLGDASLTAFYSQFYSELILPININFFFLVWSMDSSVVKMDGVGGDWGKWYMEKSFNFLTLFMHSFRREPHQINLVVQVHQKEKKVTLKFVDLLKRNPNPDTWDNQLYLEVQVDFYQDKIIYQHEECVQVIDEEELVHYFYKLMQKMPTPWMYLVCKHVFDSKCTSLKTKCMEHFLQYRNPGDSVLRHQLTSPSALGRQLMWKGRLQNVEEVKAEYISKRYERGLLYSRVPINKDNLYCFGLPLHGTDSLRARVELMAHLLLIEGVLMYEHHIWEEVYADCYHCQVEGFHFYLWREQYSTVIEYYIFFDMHIWKNMLDYGAVQPRSPCVNAYHYMWQFEVNWHYHFLEDFLYPCFFQKIPFTVRSLQQLAKDVCVSNVVMARFGILYSLGLEVTDKEIEFPETEFHWGAFFLHFLPVMAYMKDTYEELMKKDEYELKGKVHHLPPPENPTLYLNILKKATKFPLSHHLSLLRNNSNFRHNYVHRIREIVQFAGY